MYQLATVIRKDPTPAGSRKVPGANLKVKSLPVEPTLLLLEVIETVPVFISEGTTAISVLIYSKTGSSGPSIVHSWVS